MRWYWLFVVDMVGMAGMVGMVSMKPKQASERNPKSDDNNMMLMFWFGVMPMFKK